MNWLAFKEMFTILPDTPDIYPVWEDLVTRHRVIGKPAHDARLVAAMKVHGLTAILTFDRAGFSRYDGIEVDRPGSGRRFLSAHAGRGSRSYNWGGCMSGSQSQIENLYRRAFQEFGTRALWNKRLLDSPTPEDALVIARALRIEGNREARMLAEQIEQACRAAH